MRLHIRKNPLTNDIINREHFTVLERQMLHLFLSSTRLLTLRIVVCRLLPFPPVFYLSHLNFPLRINQISLPITESPEPRNTQTAPIRFTNIPPRVAKHVEGQVLRLAELLVFFNRVDGYADYLGV